MTVRLYLETNFLVGHANGRDPGTDRLIAGGVEGLEVAMPSCCVMEALTVWEGEQKRLNGLVEQNRSAINELGRNLASPHALRLADLLRAAEPEWLAGLQLHADRLREALGWAANPARVSLLATDGGRAASLHLGPAAPDPTDRLILATILDDAAGHPATTRVLVTENRRCFHDDPGVRGELIAAGVRYFKSLSKFLQWYDAQAES